MRETKYRAYWSGKMWSVVEMSNMDNQERMDILLRDEEGNEVREYRKNLELIEFTGLHDKNGKEIYQGDMFGKMGGDVERPEEYEIHAAVYFDEDLGAFCIDNQRGGWEYLSDYLSVPRNEREVIGNIYEHPHLLQEVKK